MHRAHSLPLATLTLLNLLLASACAREPVAAPAGLVQAQHTTMGSLLEISVAGPENPQMRAALDESFRAVDRLDQLMSVWKPGSDILRLNQSAGQIPVEVSQEVIDTLELAVKAGDWTDGKFDVTFGALAGLWKFDAQNQDDKIPDPAEVDRRLPLVDYQALELNPQRRTAFLQRPGMSAHLGGIGKGYAVDRVAEILHKAGLRDFLIQFGGDLYVSGLRDGRPWTLGIRDPRGPADRTFAAVALSDATFSTSGDYERFFMADGRRYHHILDPDTGEPARGARSVTIVAKTGAVADALSTGVFVMGPDAGMALVERLPDVDALIVTDRNQVLISSGLKDRVTILAQPTDAP
ncbi:MAG: FAD:protein FMN transferase [Vicinamibacterales bacterium]